MRTRSTLTRHSRRYEGPSIGAAGLSLMAQWQALAPAGAEGTPFRLPPSNWVPPFGAGFARAEGAQPLAARGWRAAGTDDESYFERPMTDAELVAQEKDTIARAKAVFDAGGVDKMPEYNIE